VAFFADYCKSGKLGEDLGQTGAIEQPARDEHTPMRWAGGWDHNKAFQCAFDIAERHLQGHSGFVAAVAISPTALAPVAFARIADQTHRRPVGRRWDVSSPSPPRARTPTQIASTLNWRLRPRLLTPSTTRAFDRVRSFTPHIDTRVVASHRRAVWVRPGAGSAISGR